MSGQRMEVAAERDRAGRYLADRNTLRWWQLRRRRQLRREADELAANYFFTLDEYLGSPR